MNDDINEPIPLPNNADGLLKRISGSQKGSESIGTLTAEKKELYGKWWEMRLLGTSITEIVKHEDGKYNERQVSNGLDRYAEICMDEQGRGRRMVQHKAFVDKLRQIAMSQVQTLRKQFLDSGMKGIPSYSEEVSYDKDGNKVASKQKLDYESMDKRLVPWMRFAVELDKYGATIDGLMHDIGQEDDINVIDINIEGFIGLGDHDASDDETQCA